MTDKALEAFHRVEAPDLTADEFGLFVERCNRRGIDPLLRFVLPRLRVDDRTGKRHVTDMTTIDAYRSIAQATGDYLGQTTPLWCGPDGKWVDVWLSNDPPRAAIVRIHRKGFVEPVGQPALWSEYVQMYRGKPSRSWANMGALMLAKCSEALAFRKAFPEQLSGTYTHDEMMQAESDLSGDERPSEPPPKPSPVAEFLARHVPAWDLARRTAAELKAEATDATREEYREGLEGWWRENADEVAELYAGTEERSRDRQDLDALFRRMIGGGRDVGIPTEELASFVRGKLAGEPEEQGENEDQGEIEESPDVDEEEEIQGESVEDGDD